MTTISIEPITDRVHAEVRPPDSLHLTNRALLIAALGHGVTLFDCARQPRGHREMRAALEQLGVVMEHDPRRERLSVHGCRGLFPVKNTEIVLKYCAVTARFLTAALAFSDGEYRLAGQGDIEHLPVDELLFGLSQLGAEVKSENGDGCLPVRIYGVHGKSGLNEGFSVHGITSERSGAGGRFAAIAGNLTSQYLSALLLAAPLAAAQGDVEIQIVDSLVSRPYVRLTLAMMHDFGIEVKSSIGSTHVLLSKSIAFVIPKGSHYRSKQVNIEPEALGANCFFAAAALLGGEVRVEGLTDGSLQADFDFVYALRRMGCLVRFSETGTTIGRDPEKPLLGLAVDMNEIVDSVPLLATLACFASTPTRISNIGFIRHREKDRITVLAGELRKLGAGIEELPDGLRIVPPAGPDDLHGAVLETHGDFRMAMGMAVAGLKIPGISITGHEAVEDCWPAFYETLVSLREQENGKDF